ncbi:hypothetical protein GRAN_3874 [Granulicella sibirica]|uniref:Uncharacterized protein n=1 Tax=Granulicella sibirica TaxID=2479048 RepID=A0A4Q0SXP6_9BACT|nr:hypothetical protein GRAN_3874 [Granulicella sibirica]
MLAVATPRPLQCVQRGFFIAPVPSPLAPLFFINQFRDISRCVEQTRRVENWLFATERDDSRVVALVDGYNFRFVVLSYSGRIVRSGLCFCSPEDITGRISTAPG